MSSITRSGVRISTDPEFGTYADTMVSGEQTEITVSGLEPDTLYFARGLAEANGRIYVSENSIRFQTAVATEDYLTFEALADNSTVEWEVHNLNDAPLIYKSTDGESWQQWDFATITLMTGDKVYMYGENPNGINRKFWDSTTYSNFAMTGSIAASGDLTSLITRYGAVSEIPQTYCFARLFYGCTALTSAPSLPSDVLKGSCYREMFSGCTALAAAPSLPATTLAAACYSYMFENCTSLTSAPTLPARTLEQGCYASMFRSCTALTESPAIAATTLAPSCCMSMFYNCTSLTRAASINASEAPSNCFGAMYQHCTSLTTAPSLPATTVGQSCYSDMFNECSSLVTPPDVLPATTLANYCYSEMFRFCVSLTSAPSLPATTLATSCYNAMFYKCMAMKTAPKIPASPTATNCYNQMFKLCSSLSAITVEATTWNSNNTQDWMDQVDSNGTFYKSAALTTIPTNSTSGIPSGWAVEDYDA